MERSSEPIISYDNITLPEKVSDVLREEIWVSESFSSELFSTIIDPVKFSASAAIFVKKGFGVVELNLIEYEIKAPAIVVIRSGQIMQVKKMSTDFDASYIVLSKKLTDAIFQFIHTSSVFSIVNSHPVVSVEESFVPYFLSFHNQLRSIVRQRENPYGYEVLLHSIIAFFFRFGYLPYEKLKSEIPTAQGRITDSFLKLVQTHYKRERFLDFYARILEITPKHLSRTVKKQTGFSAVSWIERQVVLEAQVMLKSTNLNIQQIADELNFKSQSFFGKYFKKFTGVSPKDFRNQK